MKEIKYLVPIYNHSIDILDKKPDEWELMSREQLIDMIEIGELSYLSYEVSEMTDDYEKEKCSIDAVIQVAIEEDVIFIMKQIDFDEIGDSKIDKIESLMIEGNLFSEVEGGVCKWWTRDE